MTRKQIDALHEIRLTFVQVVVPIGVGLIYLEETHPHWKSDVRKGVNKSKEYIKEKVQGFSGNVGALLF